MLQIQETSQVLDIINTRLLVSQLVSKQVSKARCDLGEVEPVRSTAEVLVKFGPTVDRLLAEHHLTFAADLSQTHLGFFTRVVEQIEICLMHGHFTLVRVLRPAPPIHHVPFTHIYTVSQQFSSVQFVTLLK